MIYTIGAVAIPNLFYLNSSLDQIESALPTLARPIMSLDANEDAIVGALKQSLVILLLHLPSVFVIFIHSFYCTCLLFLLSSFIHFISVYSLWDVITFYSMNFSDL